MTVAGFSLENSSLSISSFVLFICKCIGKCRCIINYKNCFSCYFSGKLIQKPSKRKKQLTNSKKKNIYIIIIINLVTNTLITLNYNLNNKKIEDNFVSNWKIQKEKLTIAMSVNLSL